MKTESQIKDKLLKIYAEQEKYDSFDNNIKIKILKWILNDAKQKDGEVLNE